MCCELKPEPGDLEGAPITFQSAKSMPARRLSRISKNGKSPRKSGKTPLNTPGMFRMKSEYKWDPDAVDAQKKEMQDQLAHLVQTELASSASMPF